MDPYTPVQGALALDTLSPSPAWAYGDLDGQYLTGPLSNPGSVRNTLDALLDVAVRIDPDGRGLDLAVPWVVTKHVELAVTRRALLRYRAPVRALNHLLNSRRLRLLGESHPDRTPEIAQLGDSLHHRIAWESWSVALREPPPRLDPGVSVVAVDGSYSHQAGVGVWCWYASPDNFAAGVTGPGTSYDCEILAARQALAAAASPTAPLTILSDCTSVIAALGFTPDGRRLPAAAAEIGSRPVSIRWVRGHASNSLHNQADTRARSLLRAYVAAMSPARH